MIAILMVKIETTKPPIVCQPAGSHVRWIPAACPKTGLNAAATKMPMTMTKFKNPNDNVNVNAKATMMTPHPAITHVSRRVQCSWKDVGTKHAPARLPTANVPIVAAKRRIATT